jgi:hypothetical protein
METNRINPMESALQNARLIQAKSKGTGAGAAMHGETMLAGLLVSNETPAGDLLREVQAQAVERQAVEDVRLCRKLAHLLRRRVEADGREVNDATEHDAAAVGVLAIVQWRNGVLASASRYQRQNALCRQRGRVAGNRGGNVRRCVWQFG